MEGLQGLLWQHVKLQSTLSQAAADKAIDIVGWHSNSFFAALVTGASAFKYWSLHLDAATKCLPALSQWTLSTVFAASQPLHEARSSSPLPTP
jgi:hypothetical protein